ncbi:Homeodomain GLABROUS 2 [Heracleum sosnowskyi]|uniref:Homeodomain GLABROUS 2 n=1 Tax=Heracleum sosnowskyi TaxID=360622 RepID=A0AAD8JKJ4_9APIA|nr:Homeodomain GLABROUS 2 [Heracleum sosnowskyi]
MVTPAKQFLVGEGSKSAPRFSTNFMEELGQNNSEVPNRDSAGSQYGRGGNGDQDIVSEAAAAKSLGKRKFVDEQQLEELQDSSQKVKKRCMMLPANYESQIDKAPTNYNIEAIVELVRLATEELRVMAVVTEPLWRYCPGADDGSRILDKVTYRKMFPNLVGPTQEGFASEASRETARVKSSPKHLVDILMDVSKWSATFSAIVTKASTIDVLMNPGGATDYDGTLQVMAARYQLSTPHVPYRDTYFARYCKKYSENDWIVVDVSLDKVHQVPVMRCKKRPSGCLIHGLSDGFSQIAWLEHVDAYSEDVSTMYKNLLVSGLGFGAKRWISALDRKCQQMVTNISVKVPLRDYDELVRSSNKKAWQVLLKLAAGMVHSFNLGISGEQWEEVPGHFSDNVRVMIRRIMNDPILPMGAMVSATSSIWLPLSPKSVFDFLHDHNSRSEPLIPYPGREWEVLSSENVIEQMCRIPRGQEARNCVSMHKVLAGNSSQEDIILLQESCSDPVSPYIVYSRLHTEEAMDLILSGGKEYLCILPSGFAVLPDGPATGTEGSGGSLLTLSFQLFVDGSPAFVLPAEGHSRLIDLMNCTIERIKDALEEFSSQEALFASMNEKVIN